MGIRGYIQTTQPEYNGEHCMSSWISHAAYKYLTDNGVDIWTPGGIGADADSWEIEIDDIDKLKKIASNLYEHKDALDEYLSGDLVGHERGEELANILDEGIAVAEEKHYSTIVIYWL